MEKEGKSYANYLRSSHWYSRRQRYNNYHPKRCSVCGDIFNIHLHHHSYENLGGELDCDLTWLCGYHHKMVHAFANTLRIHLLTAYEYTQDSFDEYGIEHYFDDVSDFV
jgi:hypothetical protein